MVLSKSNKCVQEAIIWNIVENVYLENCTQAESICYSCVSPKNVFTCKLHTRRLLSSNHVVAA